MSLRKIKTLRIVCLSIGLVGACVCYLCRNFTDGIFYKIILVIACLALVTEMVCWFLWRCPHCGRMLHHKGTLSIEYCPYCGEYLFDE